MKNNILSKNNFQISPLSLETLNMATKLAQSVFYDEKANPERELNASLSDSALTNYRLQVDDEIMELNYYVALLDSKVIGLIGLYLLNTDYLNTAWLGWYCVDTTARGKGIGNSLLKFAVNKARAMGKKYLCLYTSTSENEQAAQLIYERNGFHIIDVEKKDGYITLYRQKIL